MQTNLVKTRKKYYLLLWFFLRLQYEKDSDVGRKLTGEEAIKVIEVSK
jgi:hypothetical protein